MSNNSHNSSVLIYPWLPRTSVTNIASCYDNFIWQDPWPLTGPYGGAPVRVGRRGSFGSKLTEDHQVIIHAKYKCHRHYTLKEDDCGMIFPIQVYIKPWATVERPLWGTPCRGAKMGPWATICTNLIKDLEMIINAKYVCYGHNSFRKEEFYSSIIYKSM